MTGIAVRERVKSAIETHRLISIIRADIRDREEELLGVLEAGGVRVLEVSMVSPGFDAVMKKLVSKAGGETHIGAGTVLTLRDLERAMDVGARFIVSPDGNPEVIEATLRAGLVSLPGAMTPSEAVRVRSAGADYVKLFPAVTLGPAYVKALRGPLPDMKMVPTGGVALEDIPAYRAAGAVAVAIGSELVSETSIAQAEWAVLQARAAAFTQAAGRD